MHTYTLNCMSLNCTSIFTYITYISDISMHRKRSLKGTRNLLRNPLIVRIISLRLAPSLCCSNARGCRASQILCISTALNKGYNHIFNYDHIMLHAPSVIHKNITQYIVTRQVQLTFYTIKFIIISYLKCRGYKVFCAHIWANSGSFPTYECAHVNSDLLTLISYDIYKQFYYI